jgi:hypothetical protein
MVGLVALLAQIVANLRKISGKRNDGKGCAKVNTFIYTDLSAGRETILLLDIQGN